MIPCACVEGEGAFDEADDGGCAVVVRGSLRRRGGSGHRRSRARSRSRPSLSCWRAAGRDPGQLVAARFVETRVGADVHVQQVARAGPLVAVGRLPLLCVAPARSRGAAAPSRRSSAGTLSGRQRVLAPSPSACGSHRSVCSSSGASRLGLRPGRLERSNRHDRLARSSSVACRHRCHQRCAVAGDTRNSLGSLPDRAARSNREHELTTARQSEPRVTVNPHLVLLLAERRRRRTASKEDRMNP